MRHVVATGVAGAFATAAIIALAGGRAAAAGPAAEALPLHAAAPAATFDFGDAPDGAPARYVEKPLVRGAFPSRAARGGPRHPSSGPRIGLRWTSEADSRQVDGDTDDGAQVVPRRCALSTVTLALDASRVAGQRPVYVNAWFDWNQDGDWADGGTSRCGPEWALQNIRIDPASLGPERTAVLTLRFRAGRVPSQFWWRLQVHAGDPVPHAGGGGQGTPTSGGETEDLFFNRLLPLRQPQVALSCTTGAGVIPHGRTHHATFQLVGGYGARVAVSKATATISGFREGVSFDRSVFPPRRWVVSVQSTREHERDPVVQTVSVRLRVEFFVNGRSQSGTATCSVAIVHAKHVAPPFQPPPIEEPVKKGAIDPIRPDPVAAACRSSFTPAGYTPGSLGAQGGTVEVRCDGVDVKSMSVHAGSTGQKIASFSSSTGQCTPISPSGGVENGALQCVFRGPNKGRVIGFTYTTDRAFASAPINVLAGGSRLATTGTTFVLRQTFHFLREGILCRQSVPATSGDVCATL